MKRQRRELEEEEEVSGGWVKEEEEDEEERLAEEKLRQLQELAERSNCTQPSSSSSPSSSPSKACVKSSWQQIGNLLLYTAAGVRGSDKVGKEIFICVLIFNFIAL